MALTSKQQNEIDLDEVLVILGRLYLDTHMAIRKLSRQNAELMDKLKDGGNGKVLKPSKPAS